MISQPIRAICILLAILAIASCNNSADKIQQTFPTRQSPFGDKAIPAGHIHAASNYRTAVSFRPVSQSNKTAKDAYGRPKQIMPYHLFLGRVLLRFCSSKQVEQ